MKKQIWVCLPVILLTACASPRLYRGEETAQLIARSDFVAAANAAPEFTRAAMQTIGRLEYEYYLAKEGAKDCPKCREQTRRRLESLIPPPVVRQADHSLPPTPPLPAR